MPPSTKKYVEEDRRRSGLSGLPGNYTTTIRTSERTNHHLRCSTEWRLCFRGRLHPTAGGHSGKAVSPRSGANPLELSRRGHRPERNPRAGGAARITGRNRLSFRTARFHQPNTQKLRHSNTVRFPGYRLHFPPNSPTGRSGNFRDRFMSPAGVSATSQIGYGTLYQLRSRLSGTGSARVVVASRVFIFV